jgi:choline dehydrogenase-like flavoprotein
VIQSLRHQPNSPETASDVCIIGGGTAGLLLAVRLRQLGFHVIVIEAGDDVARRPAEIDQVCEHRGIRYRGAEQGRAFGLGGTSALWGGQLIPLLASDFLERPAGFDSWPIQYNDVAQYYPHVCEQLGLPTAYGENAWQANDPAEKKFPLLARLSPDFQLRISAWLPFASRNFAKLFSARLGSDDKLQVWLDAQVTGFAMEHAGERVCFSNVTARGNSGQSLVIKAKYFVVCAGALESTRLLLEADESHRHFLTALGCPLGRYFADHLSVRCGDIECHNWRKFNFAVAPVFTRGIMRTPRLELAAGAQVREKLASAFAHFTFLTNGETGFDIVRNVLRRRQGERQELGLSLGKIGRVVNDVTAMALYRYGFHRLWIPRASSLVLQVDIEQVPNYHSRVYLGQERDRLDRRRLIVDWRITDQDIRTIREVTALATAAWNNSELKSLATMWPTLPSSGLNFDTLYDVYHPTGLLRMGQSPESSVVDKHLLLWGTSNCFVSSTAVFPSAGSANPGLTHLALTLRLADHLVELLNDPRQAPAMSGSVC